MLSRLGRPGESRSPISPYYRSIAVYWVLLVALFSLPLEVLSRDAPSPRSLPELTASQIEALVTATDPSRNLDTSNPTSHLSKILIPRSPGTENNTLVKNYIVSTLKKLNWHVEEDSFTDSTPYGVKPFTNVIATKDPKASKRVVLAAHFDSKYFSEYPQNQFLGATDSAAPCAMMLDLAETLNSLLDHRSEQLESGSLDDEEEDLAETTLQLVFFDGEEAFKDWTATDSVYGARHLAEKWATTYVDPLQKRRMRYTSTEIDGVEHLVLLDLLGAPNPTIQSYFPETGWLFDAMVSAEQRLVDSGAFNKPGDANAKAEFRSFFRPRKYPEFVFGGIEDDHIPFLRKGVNILHIITNPFPHVWHTLKDDASALDLETMRRWNLILRIFFAEYLGLRPESNQKKMGRSMQDLPLPFATASRHDL